MKCKDKDLLKIIYVDNHLLACEKPPMLCTQTPPSGEESLEDRAKAWVKREYHKPGRVFLHAVHRLDKQVGGIVLFARTSKALRRMQSAMRARKVEKRYIAVVEGVMQKDEGDLEHDLAHGSHRAYVSSEKGGKRAHLHYKVLQKTKRESLLEVELFTGRYHQIRAQLSAIGHPIVGDTKYGAKESGEGISLWHAKMVFAHPVTHETVILLSTSAFAIL